MIDILDGLHGAYTYPYARSALGEYGLRAAVDNGDLVGFGRGVLLDARRVLDLRTRCAGALLLTGGVLVGPTAAALHGCSAIGGFPVHVRVPYTQRIRSRNGLVVHQGDVTPGEVTVMDGLRVLTMDRTITEVLCSAPRRTALACADQLLRAMRAEDRPDFIESVATQLAARPDRRGTKQAARLLSLASGLPESPAQSAFLLVLADSGFPKPECQYEIRDHNGQVRHRLDFAWPAHQVALEHEDNDPSRAEDLHRRGWLILQADTE
ncbi:MAG TPA: hypothetical protein VH352_18540, partial [Pseudonocardiaceae bacterium]|nr:hypothetical protein [Pseudonocardiaceae bacterium]